MKEIIRLYNRLTRIGLANDFDDELDRKIIIANKITFFHLVGIITLVFFYLFVSPLPYLVIIPATFFVICIVILYLNHINLYLLSRTLICLCATLSCLTPYLLGKHPSSSSYLIPPLLLVPCTYPFLLFKWTERKYFIGFVLFSAIICLGYPYYVNIMPEVVHFAKEEYILNRMAGDAYAVIFLCTLLSIYVVDNHIQSQQATKLYTKSVDQNERMLESQKALSNMLEELEEKRKKEIQQSKISHWSAEVNSILYQTQEESEIYHQLISRIAQKLGVYQSGIYIVEDQNPEDMHIKLLASYAYNQADLQLTRIEIGDGLLGQVYLDKEKIILDSLPTDYSKITSGLGEARPTYLAIIPLKVNNDVEGLMELASFNALKDFEIEFLERIGENIAAAMASQKAKNKTHAMLIRSHEQTEQMRQNEITIKQNLKELEVAQQEMIEQEQAIRSMLKEKEASEKEIKGHLIEAKLKQQELDKLLYRLELTSDIINEASWYVDVPENPHFEDDTPIYWNNRIREMLDLPDDNPYTKTLGGWIKLLHPDDLMRIQKAFNAHVFDYSSKTNYHVEYRMGTQHQGYKWFRVRAITKRDQDGKPLIVVGVATEIEKEKETKRLLEQTQAQRELLQAQEEETLRSIEELHNVQQALIKEKLENESLLERFQLIMGVTEEGIWDAEIPDDLVLNDDTPVIWSDRHIEMMGYCVGHDDFPELLGFWSRSLHPDDAARAGEAFYKHLMDFTDQTPYDVEYRLRMKDGTYRWFRAIGKTKRDQDGKPLRAAGTLIDIQDSKDIQAYQKRLTQELAKYRHIFNRHPEAIMIMDQDANYVHCNEAAAQLFDTTVEKLITMNMKDQSPKKQLNNRPSDALLKKYIQTAYTKDAVQFDWNYLGTKKDGFLEANIQLCLLKSEHQSATLYMKIDRLS